MASEAEGQYYEVVSSHVRVRKERDLDAGAWGSLDRGQKVLVLPYDGGPWAELSLFELWRTFRCEDPSGRGFIHCAGSNPLIRGPLKAEEAPAPDRAKAAGLQWQGVPRNLPPPRETDLYLNRWLPAANEDDCRCSPWCAGTAPAAPGARPPRLCIGAMLKGAPEVCLLSWILYHFRVGFERLYLFFDDPFDPSAAVADLFTKPGGAAAGEKAVVVHRMSEEWWNRRVFGKFGANVNLSRYQASYEKDGRGGWGYDVMEAHRLVRDIPARQQICLDLAAQDAQADGLDWILHIDIDELFYLPEAECREDAQRWFARVPVDVECVRFNNHECIPGFEVDDWFREVTFFRVNKQFLQPARENRGRWRDSTPLDPGGDTEDRPEDDSDFGELDGPGVYVLTKLAIVTTGVGLDSERQSTLEAGSLVHVMEMVYHREDTRLRGRIRFPSGWISILNKKTGYRWAERKAVNDAPGDAQQAPQAAATYVAGQTVELKSFKGMFKGTWWPCQILGPGDEPGTYHTCNEYGVWPNIQPSLLRKPRPPTRGRPKSRREQTAREQAKYQKAFREMLEEMRKVRTERSTDLGQAEVNAGSATHFLGYIDGKAAARLPRSGPAPVPAFVTRFKKIKGEDLKPCVRRRADGDADPVVLHYANCGFSYWITKYKMLGQFPDTVMGFQNTMKAHLASRNLLTNAGRMHWDARSFRKLELYYRTFVMGNEFGELPFMVSRGLAVLVNGARDIVDAARAQAAAGSGPLGATGRTAMQHVTGETGRRVESSLSVANSWKEAMLSRTMHVVWLVLGSAGLHGVPVRQGPEEAACMLPKGLQPGARLEHLETQGRSVRFRKLDGEGPDTGWADVQGADGRELLRLACWQWDTGRTSGAFCLPLEWLVPPPAGGGA